MHPAQHAGVAHVSPPHGQRAQGTRADMKQQRAAAAMNEEGRRWETGRCPCLPVQDEQGDADGWLQPCPTSCANGCRKTSGLAFPTRGQSDRLFRIQDTVCQWSRDAFSGPCRLSPVFQTETFVISYKDMYTPLSAHWGREATPARGGSWLRSHTKAHASTAEARHGMFSPW